MAAAHHQRHQPEVRDDVDREADDDVDPRLDDRKARRLPDARRLHKRRVIGEGRDEHHRNHTKPSEKIHRPYTTSRRFLKLPCTLLMSSSLCSMSAKSACWIVPCAMPT